VAIENTKNVRVIAGLSLVAAANLFAIGYVGAEAFFYHWDWSAYWNRYALLGELSHKDGLLALQSVAYSIRYEDYNFLPVLPLIPVERLFGAGRLPYILAITNISLLPAAAAMAMVADRAFSGQSNVRLLLCSVTILIMHVLWVPALRGMPDVLGVAIASGILLFYFREPPADRSWVSLATVGALLCLLVLTRRWYLFWAVSFFPAAVAAHLAEVRARADWRTTTKTLKSLAVVGLAMAAFIIMFAAPKVVEAINRDYSSAYSGYRAELAGGRYFQVVRHFGAALLFLSSAGIASLVARRRSRGLGIFLIVQAVVCFALFTHVQPLLGPQHYYLLLPACAIGAAAAVAGLWESRFRLRWRLTSVALAMTVVLLSSFASMAPTGPAIASILPSERYPPLVRDDLNEVEQLLRSLSAAKPTSIYIVAGSQVFNSSMMSTAACNGVHPDLCPRIANTQDVDARDGFPVEFLDADYLVLGTPNQFHLLPKDQQVVSRLANAVRQGRGVGESYQRLGRTFHLTGGIKADIYRRTQPLTRKAVNALSDELAASYPGRERLFRPPDEQVLRLN
jgi:hypothetical protein